MNVINEQLIVRTPENIRLHYDIAGLGSRFFAQIIDYAIQSILLVAFTKPFYQWKLESIAELPERLDGLSSLYLSILALFIFLITFGYYIFFEFFWDGQTPGKKILGLKVRRVGGYPLDFLGAFLRNILRVVDILPSFYIVGFLSAFFNSSGRRIGDLVAGTIVIRESRRRLPEPLKLTPEIDEEQRRILLGGTLPMNIDGQMREIREFLRRRGRFTKVARERLAQALLVNAFPHLKKRWSELTPGEAEIFLGVIHRWYESQRLDGAEWNHRCQH